MNNRVAAIIVNYNMPERTDALCSYIKVHVKWPYDLIVVDNGSDPKYPSEWTTVKLQQNVQTTNGWLCGVAYAKGLASMRKEPYLGYWFMITSAEFVKESKDPLTPIANILLDIPDAVVASPALTKDSTTAHVQMITRGGNDPRRTWLLDNIAALWRADWLDSIGGFPPELTMAWGCDFETCYLARKAGKSIWIHEGTRVKKISDIGYTMDRMGMTAEERGPMAGLEMRNYLVPKYGEDYDARLHKEYTDPKWCSRVTRINEWQPSADKEN